MVGNIFSNAGIASSGMNDAQMDTETLAQTKQQTAAGAIHLGDIQREDQSAKALREATANATPDIGVDGALTSYANQQKANGDMQGYQSTLDSQQDHRMQVMTRLAQATAYGLPPEKTEQYLSQNMGQTFVPGSLEYGTDPKTNKHMATVIDAKTNQRVTVMPDALGFLAAQQKPMDIGPGHKAVQPLTGTELANNPQAKPTGQGGTFNEQTGAIIAPNQPRRSEVNITRNFAPKSAGATKSDLPAMKAIKDSVSNSPGLGTIDRQTGKIVGTQDANTRIADAQSIYLNDRTIPPADAANAVNFGKRATGPNGEKAYVYNGKFYKLAPSGQQMQTQSPAPNDEVNDENVANDNENYARGGKVNSKGLG